MLDPYFRGFSVCGSTTGLLLVGTRGKHCIVGCMMRGHTVCVFRKAGLFSSRQKNKVNGCFTPPEAHSDGGLFIAFMEQDFFDLALFSFFF